MRWVVGIVLLMTLSSAWADETPVYNGEPGQQEAADAYDQAILKFNRNIKDFPSWEAFKTEIMSLISPGTTGRCYESTRDAMQPVKTTRVNFQEIADNHWQETSGNGWRHNSPDRTFVEYRVNLEHRLLLRIEGVKPWFFFAHTKRICEFPLSPP